MNSDRKKELLKIALSAKVVIKNYEDSFGPDEASKFMNGHNLVKGPGNYVPVAVAYYFYYQWAKEPIPHTNFFLQMSKYIKSEARSVRKLRVTYVAYRMSNFPEYGPAEELQARRLLDEQKEKNKKKKLKKQARKILRKKES